jgi:hypothetical protein
VSDDLELLAGLVAHCALIALPIVAAMLVAAKKGLRDPVVILGLGLLASGASALLSFGAYYAAPSIGIAWDWCLLVASMAAILLCLRGGLPDPAALEILGTPLVLWVLGTSFVVFLGFLHGGVHEAVNTPAVRFSQQLPSDNDIPRYFTEWFAAHGHAGPPPVYPGGWLMSDRPPLQIGYMLSQHAFVNTAQVLHYELIGVALQQLWIIGMWALLVAARVTARARALAMGAAMISDVAIINGFFVWPKLLAAAFLLAGLALVLSPSWSRYRRDPRVGALLGGLLAMAMLSHGSSVFGVVGLVAFVVIRGVPGWRWIVAAVLIGGITYAPWIAYQHYADPPGNRLLKWQLGGEPEISQEGTLDTIANGYGKAGVGGTLRNKEVNFEEIVGILDVPHDTEIFVESVEAGDFKSAVAAVRAARFFSLFAFLGVFLLSPILMLLRRRRRRAAADWEFALRGFAFVAISCVAWGLLLYGGSEAVTEIVVGSLAVPLVALCACVVGLHSVYPRLAAAMVAANVLFVLVLYAPALQPAPGSTYSPALAVLAAAVLVLIAMVLFGFRRPTYRRRRSTDQVVGALTGE